MPEDAAHGHHAAGSEREPRQFVKYTFYKVRPEWRLLPVDAKKAQKREFAAALHDLEEELVLRTYSLVGIRADADFMVWAIDPRLESFRDMARRLSSTELGHYLDTSYAYLGATRPSEYFGGSSPASEERAATKALPRGGPYLIVYPFWKKREWYSVPFEKRQEIGDAPVDHCGRHHEPQRPRLFQFLHEIRQRRCPDGFLLRHLLHCFRRHVEDHTLMAALEQAPHHVGTHPTESDHSELHAALLSTWSRTRERATQRQFVSLRLSMLP